MVAQIARGKEVAKAIKQEVKERITRLYSSHSVTPSLTVILVGNDPASEVYVKNKTKTSRKLGINSQLLRFGNDITTADLLQEIERLNSAPEVTGILVQLPLPPHIDNTAILNAIAPAKDVDGFHPVNVGALVRGDADWAACTPAGIIKLLEYYNVDISGKESVVLGRSDIVGKPMAMLLLHRNATVTICHSKTRNLSRVTRRADILISAMGRPGMVTADYVKEGAAVIDVGTVRISEGEAWPELFEEGSVWQKSFSKKGYALVGDVRFHEVLDKAALVTPVPGGVGPLTIAMLMYNTVLAAERQHKG